MSTLTSDFLKEAHGVFESDPKNLLARNVVTRSGLDAGLVDRDVQTALSHVYSHKVSFENKASNQKSSGRCWLFAALNTCRHGMMRHYNLPKSFELSQTHLFFYDKLERANRLYQLMKETAKEGLGLDSREVHHLLVAESPVNDGGQWDMIVSLVDKYGLVPKSVWGESNHTGASRALNGVLLAMLRGQAKTIREAVVGGQAEEEVDATIKGFLQAIYNVLVIFMGTPPTTFDWQYTNASGEYVEYTGLTPHSFYDAFVAPHTDLRQYVSLIHDPRNEYGRAYTVKYLGNVWGTPYPVRYINVPINVMKGVTRDRLQADRPVWFGCDVGKEHLRDKAAMEMGVKDWGLLLGDGAVPSLDKKCRLQYGQSLMTHAMVFTGFHAPGVKTSTVPDGAAVAEAEGKAVVKVAKSKGDAAEGGGAAEPVPLESITKWRVENSWSTDRGDGGYYSMGDTWFSEYTYQIAVPRSAVPEEYLKALDGEVTVLPPWDPMGALAQ